MATVMELASFIRKHKPVRFGVVCTEKHIAPSTLYGYIKIMLDVCTDIHYENGVFHVKRDKHHRMPDGALVET